MKRYLNAGDVIKEINRRYFVGNLMIKPARIGSLIIKGYLRYDELQQEYIFKKKYELSDDDITNEEMEVEREHRLIEIRNTAINRGLW